MTVRYPDAPPGLTPEQDLAWTTLIKALRQRDGQSFFGTASPLPYIVSCTASYRVSSASTLIQLSDTLGTLLTNLKAKGIIS